MQPEVAVLDEVRFGRQDSGGKRAAAVGIGALVTSLVAGWAFMTGVPSPSDRVTEPEIYRMDGERNWSLSSYDVVIDRTAQGWEVRGNRSFDPNGFRFSINPTQEGWRIQGKSIMGFLGYYADVVQQPDGQWLIRGDQEGTPGFGSFTFTTKPNGQGGYVIEGDKAWTLGNYEFRVTPTADGWHVEGGADLRSDFVFDLKRNAEGTTLTEVEGLAVALPAVLSIMLDMDK